MWYEKAIHEFWISCPSGVPADFKSTGTPSGVPTFQGVWVSIR